MKSTSLSKVIRAVKASQDEMSFQLRQVTAKLNQIERNIKEWNNYYNLILDEISDELKKNKNTDNLRVFTHQKQSITSFLTSLEKEKQVYAKEFEKIAEKLKREQNKVKFLKEKLKKQLSEEKKEKERNIEIDIVELWQMKN